MSFKTNSYKFKGTRKEWNNFTDIVHLSVLDSKIDNIGHSDMLINLSQPIEKVIEGGERHLLSIDIHKFELIID